MLHGCYREVPGKCVDAGEDSKDYENESEIFLAFHGQNLKSVIKIL